MKNFMSRVRAVVVASGINPEILKSQIRALIIAAAAAVAGWLTAEGWITKEQWTQIATSPLAAVIVTIVVGLIWDAFSHTESNAVAVVGEIAKRPDSPVKAVITEDTPEGHELAKSIPGPTVVAAGTPQAVAVAR